MVSASYLLDKLLTHHIFSTQTHLAGGRAKGGGQRGAGTRGDISQNFDKNRECFLLSPPPLTSSDGPFTIPYTKLDSSLVCKLKLCQTTFHIKLKKFFDTFEV